VGKGEKRRLWGQRIQNLAGVRLCCDSAEGCSERAGGGPGAGAGASLTCFSRFGDIVGAGGGRGRLSGAVALVGDLLGGEPRVRHAAAPLHLHLSEALVLERRWLCLCQRACPADHPRAPPTHPPQRLIHLDCQSARLLVLALDVCLRQTRQSFYFSCALPPQPWRLSISEEGFVLF